VNFGSSGKFMSGDSLSSIFSRRGAGAQGTNQKNHTTLPITYAWMSGRGCAFPPLRAPAPPRENKTTRPPGHEVHGRARNTANSRLTPSRACAYCSLHESHLGSGHQQGGCGEVVPTSGRQSPPAAASSRSTPPRSPARFDADQSSFRVCRASTSIPNPLAVKGRLDGFHKKP
jgi:hypothetical protein